MKFYGAIGYGEPAQTAPGVWEDVIVERKYYGDINPVTRQLEPGQQLNDNISVQNTISILADAYASGHIFAIRYVEWQGALWKVSSVDASQRPRLILRLGEVYNGPKAEAADPLEVDVDFEGYSVEGPDVDNSGYSFVINSENVVDHGDNTFSIL